MRLSYHLGLFAPLLLTVASEQLVIPEFERIASSVVSSASSKIENSRPTGNVTSSVVEPTNAPSPQVHSDAATTYWYEQIAHQGISAFGPSGYAVYRNVKDYGAKGLVSTFTVSNLY